VGLYNEEDEMKRIAIFIIFMSFYVLAFADGSSRVYSNGDLDQYGGGNGEINIDQQNFNRDRSTPQNSDVENTFKARLLQYNKAIVEAHEQAAKHVKNFAGSVGRQGRVAQQYTKEESQTADEYIDKENDLKRQRSELKSEVVLYYGKLPDWWIE